MQTTTETTARGRSYGVLWFCVLAGPIAWAIQLVVNYGLEEVLACTPGTGFSGEIWGLGVRTWILAINGTLGALTLVALALSVRLRLRLRGTDPSSGRVASWMALAGLINGVVFSLIIFVGLIPPLMLRTCELSP